MEKSIKVIIYSEKIFSKNKQNNFFLFSAMTVAYKVKRGITI